MRHYFLQQKYELALDDHNKAIELNPNYAMAYSVRALHYSSQQKYDLALDDYNKAIELNPNYGAISSYICKYTS